MFHIAEVQIEGFWGKYIAETKFQKDVNILIGKNGTGKTTFMDLLFAVLSVDLYLLSTLYFSRVTIRLAADKKSKKITITKEQDEKFPIEIIKYKLGKSIFTLPLRSYYDPQRYPRSLSAAHREKLFELKNEMKKIINLSSLSVHRTTPSIDDEENDDYMRRRRDEPRKPAVDRHLEKLVQKLTSYQLEISKTENQISTQFQKDVLVAGLYNEDFDKRIDLFSISQMEIGNFGDMLFNAYRDLGALDSNTREKINKHIKALKQSFIYYEKIRSGNVHDINFEELLPLPLFRRTKQIIDLSTKADEEKQKITEPIRKFISIVSDFMKDKTVDIDPSNGELIINKDDEILGVFELSSGEKQILIFLIETLLQRNKPYIFLADEPELSLHIEWQEKIISSIQKLNDQAQVIVATHSPEIAAGWKNSIIIMGDVINA